MNDQLIAVCEAMSLEFNREDMFVAGGAVRDYVNHRPIKDYDLYIRLDAHPLTAFKISSRIANVESILEIDAGTARPRSSKVYHCDIYYHYKMKYAEESFDLLFFMAAKKNTPSVWNMENYIDDVYDIGLCECYMDMYGEMLGSERFHKDVANHTLTCYIKDSMLDDNLRVYGVYQTFTDHIFRLQKKYPWDVKIVREDDNVKHQRFLPITMGN